MFHFNGIAGCILIDIIPMCYNKHLIKTDFLTISPDFVQHLSEARGLRDADSFFGGGGSLMAFELGR